MNGDFTRDDGGPGPSGTGGDGHNGSDNGDRGDKSRDRGGDNGHQNCLMALQVPGAMVRDTTLGLTSAGAIWDRVDLDS
jgi:hypothetical protein